MPRADYAYVQVRLPRAYQRALQDYAARLHTQPATVLRELYEERRRRDGAGPLDPPEQDRRPRLDYYRRSLAQVARLVPRHLVLRRFLELHGVRHLRGDLSALELRALLVEHDDCAVKLSRYLRHVDYLLALHDDTNPLTHP